MASCNVKATFSMAITLYLIQNSNNVGSNGNYLRQTQEGSDLKHLKDRHTKVIAVTLSLCFLFLFAFLSLSL